MNQIRALLLDVGQVLVTLNYPAPVLQQVMRHSALSEIEIQSRIVATPLVGLYETGKMPTDRFYREMIGLLEMEDIGLEPFKLGWGTIFVLPGEAGRCVSPALFRELKQRFRLIAVSNTNEIHWEYLESRLPLLHEFDDLVLSHRVGAMKPDPLIYRAALERAACLPEEALFVDDLEANVEGATALGINGLVYRDEAQFRADLARLHLLD